MESQLVTRRNAFDALLSGSLVTYLDDFVGYYVQDEEGQVLGWKCCVSSAT